MPFISKFILLLSGVVMEVHLTAGDPGGVSMPSTYSLWVGQAVVLQVATGDLRVPLRGVIVGESDGAIRFRIGEGWDIDIYKPMIMAVEQDNWATIITNQVRSKLGDSNDE
jgi:hypothetical protein